MDISFDTFRNFVGYSELLASIVGTIYFYKYKHTHLKVFLFLLWYITLSEFFAKFIAEHDIKSLLYFNDSIDKYVNTWVYNVLDSISFLTYYYIFYHSIISKKFKLWIKNFALIYISFSIVNWIFIQNFFKEFQSYLFVLGAILLIVSIVFYFIELLKSEKILVFHKNLLFWISIGLLMYYSGNIPFAAELNGYALIPGIHKLFLIVYILAITMYLTFTFGFIWSRKE